MKVLYRTKRFHFSCKSLQIDNVHRCMFNQFLLWSILNLSKIYDAPIISAKSIINLTPILFVLRASNYWLPILGRKESIVKRAKHYTC